MTRKRPEPETESESQAETFSTHASGERLHREAVHKIISYQFDLEILHKLREVKVIVEEIERGERIKELLEKLIINGTWLSRLYAHGP